MKRGQRYVPRESGNKSHIANWFGCDPQSLIEDLGASPDSLKRGQKPRGVQEAEGRSHYHYELYEMLDCIVFALTGPISLSNALLVGEERGKRRERTTERAGTLSGGRF